MSDDNAVTILIPEADRIRARHAMERELEGLRNIGFEVEVLKDLFVAAVVRVTSEGGDSIEMAVDPMGYMQQLRDKARRQIN